MSSWCIPWWAVCKVQGDDGGEPGGYEWVLEEDETALGKVLLGATSVCTIYILPMCYVMSFWYVSDLWGALGRPFNFIFLKHFEFIFSKVIEFPKFGFCWCVFYLYFIFGPGYQITANWIHRWIYIRMYIQNIARATFGESRSHQIAQALISLAFYVYHEDNSPSFQPLKIIEVPTWLRRQEQWILLVVDYISSHKS